MAKKVLIVDDDPDFVEAISVLLEAKGYAISSSEDGEKGFEKAKAEVPDLIMLDVMMTKKGEGFDIARNLKNEDVTKDIPIIIVTGVKREMSLSFGFEPDETWLPVKEVLEKPVKPEVLLGAIEKYIN